MRLRQSLMSVWMECPLQAKFQEVDLLPRQQHARATFGTCIHHACEIYNKRGNIEEAVEAFKDVWDSPEKLGVVPDFWPKYMTYASFRERGINMLLDYHSKLKWEGRKVIATEHKFLVPIGDHELTGTVDLVELKKDRRGKKTLRICDYKTNTKAPTLATLRYNNQFTTYIFASLQPEFWVGNGPNYPGLPNGEQLWKEYKNTPRRGVWYQLMQNKEIDAGERTDEDFMRLYRLITEIEKAVSLNVFVPSVSADACLYCSYTEQCGIVIPNRDEIEESEIQETIF